MSQDINHPAILSALRFIGVEPWRAAGGQISIYWLKPTDPKYPNSGLNSLKSCPVVLLGLYPSWMEMVHERGLDRLPWPPKGIRPSYILHAEDHIPFGAAKVAPAIWTNGGRSRHEGFIAWESNYWTGEVTKYATGSTMQRALKKLTVWAKALQSPDLDALSELSL